MLLACSTAAADIVAEAHRPSPIEAGLYAGGFISNYFHQFYDIEAQPNRQELERVNPMVGVRFAYWITPMVGVEAEAAWTLATTKVTQEGANIFGVRAQGIVQKHVHPRLAPFASLGLGVARVSSDDMVLGSDTDMLLHVGGGARVFLTDAIALRAEGRFLRGPSQQAPYHLNASYGEFLVGVSFVPNAGGSAPRVNRPDVVGSAVDTDGDGIPDASDACPSEPEDKDLYDDTDGCPDPDNDGDGIPDGADACPMAAEDKDGFEDDDGCPDKDNDADGVPDAQDGCPDEAEDKDGHRDAVGCPDPDNDEDGIADAQDKCPGQEETINGIDDNDGCPDAGDAAVVLSPDRLELFGPIAFTGRTAKLTKANTSILGQIGAMLRRHKQILRLRITVHVQPSNDPDKDMALSEERGNAVRDWLVEWGVDRKRLEVRGFGSTKPLVPKAQKNSTLVNDRVELIILERQ